MNEEQNGYAEAMAPIPMLREVPLVEEGSATSTAGVAFAMMMQSGVQTEAALAQERRRHSDTRHAMFRMNDENEKIRKAHRHSCDLIAEMHAAVYGGQARDPERGVVGDVKDLYRRWENSAEAVGYFTRSLNGLEGSLEEAGKRTDFLEELLQEAMGVIANVGMHKGGWDEQDAEWVSAAERWRDRWHSSLLSQSPPPPLVYVGEIQSDDARIPDSVHQMVKDAENPLPTAASSQADEMFKFAGGAPKYRDLEPGSQATGEQADFPLLDANQA